MVQLSFLTTALPRVFCVNSTILKSSGNGRNLTPKINSIISANYRRPKPVIGGCLPINKPEFKRDKRFKIAPEPNARPIRVPVPEKENQFQEVIEDTSEQDRCRSHALIEKVNNYIASGNTGRLFAVIYVHGKQFRVTNEDIIVLERYWPPKPGDKLIFEKVLLVGGASFSLIGKPVLPNNLVRVHATVINKDMTHTKIRFRHMPKERVHQLNFVREQTSFIRINDIELLPKLNVTEPAVYTRA